MMSPWMATTRKKIAKGARGLESTLFDQDEVIMSGGKANAQQDAEFAIPSSSANQ